MSKSSFSEHEVQTEWSRQKSVRLQERFLKGPIPIRLIGAAAKLPGQALSVYLAVHHQTALTRREWVTLPKGLLDQFGVSRDAKARALQALETADLVHVVRAKGRPARSSLVAGPADAAVASPRQAVLWDNAHWTLTVDGLLAKHQQYKIGNDQLADLRDIEGHQGIAMWPLQMAEKSWVDIETFIEAFQQAFNVYKPSGWDAIDLDESFRLARIRADQRKSV